MTVFSCSTCESMKTERTKIRQMPQKIRWFRLAIWNVMPFLQLCTVTVELEVVSGRKIVVNQKNILAINSFFLRFSLGVSFHHFEIKPKYGYWLFVTYILTHTENGLGFIYRNLFFRCNRITNANQTTALSLYIHTEYTDINVY